MAAEAAAAAAAAAQRAAHPTEGIPIAMIDSVMYERSRSNPSALNRLRHPGLKLNIPP